jgi:hypothetical protein
VHAALKAEVAAMPNNKPDDIDRDMEWRLKQAQAVLDLFEKDCGRRAATMAEVRHWAGAQNRQHLQFRVKRRLLELLFGNPDVEQRAVTGFLPPPRGWRGLRRNPQGPMHRLLGAWRRLAWAAGRSRRVAHQ